MSCCPPELNHSLKIGQLLVIQSIYRELEYYSRFKAMERNVLNEKTEKVQNKTATA